MSVHTKTFCLKCRKTNACSCGTTVNIIGHSHKLRPPTTKNKVVWRKFIKDCPQFINLVSGEAIEPFNKFLKSISWDNNDKINGRTIPLVAAEQFP